MRKTIAFTLGCSLIATTAFARTPKEIAGSGELKVGLRVKDTVYLEGKEELQTKLAKEFGKFLSKKYKKSIEVKFVVASSMSEIWQDKNKKIRKGESYTPEYFNKVDIVADVITINEWRQKMASPVAFIPIKESFVCNYKEKKMTFKKIRSQKIDIYTVKSTSFHTILQNEGFKDNELKFTDSTGELIGAISGTKKKSCTILDSDYALYNASKKSVFFAGPASKKVNRLGWWTAQKNTALLSDLKEFWKWAHGSKVWKDSFKSTYGLSFGKYVSITGNL